MYAVNKRVDYRHKFPTGSRHKYGAVITDADANAALSFRNRPDVHVRPTGELNAYDVLVSDFVVFSQEALPTAEAAVKAQAEKAAAKPAAAAPTASEEKPAPTSDAGADKTSATEEKAGVDEPSAPEDTDFGPDSHAPLANDVMPEGFPVKGNADSMKFHKPGGRWYESTVAEVWFTTAEAAVAAGFIEAGTKASSEEE